MRSRSKTNSQETSVEVSECWHWLSPILPTLVSSLLYFGNLIGIQDILTPCQRSHQHDQSRAWQVEISDHTVYHLKIISWQDEQIRRSFKCLHLAIYSCAF